jgi:hypothetical protein
VSASETTRADCHDTPTVAHYALSGQAPRLTDALILAERVQPGPWQGPEWGDYSYYYLRALRLWSGGEGGAGGSERGCGSGLQVQLNLMGLGEPEDFGGLNVERGESPLLAKSRIWISRTPFVPTRHPKVTRAGVPKRDTTGLQIGSPEHELRRLLRLAGFPEPVLVEPLAGTTLGGREVPWRDFLRRRAKGEGRRTADGRGYGFRIEFAEAVRGLVAARFRAHYGLGVFVLF